MITAATVLDELHTLSSEQIQRIYLRRQPSAHVIGVRFGDLAKVITRNRGNSALARDLWKSRAFEARHVACKIMIPANVTEVEIDRWVGEIDMPVLSDDLAALVYATPWADQKRRQWMRLDDEFVRRAGYTLAHLAALDPQNPIPDEELLGYLDTVKREIHDSANWAREMMNYIPIAVGRRSDVLYEPALAGAQTYG